MQTAMEQVADQSGQLTVQLSAAAVAELELTEDDVPGAALGRKLPEELKVPELKRWLACRGASRTGLKPQLIQRVNEYIKSRKAKRIVDPDKGANLEVKKRRLSLVPGSSGLPPLAPSTGWRCGLGGIPTLKYCQVYNYLVASKAITSDGSEMGAMKSLKAIKYFKEGYVQDLRINLEHSQYAYLQSQTQASMKRTFYKVEVCMSKCTADILAACCDCPAGEWPSAACSHIAATLFAAEDYVTHMDQSCTSRLQQWHQPKIRANLPTPISQAEFKKVTGKMDDNHTRACVVRPIATCYDPRRPADRCINIERFENLKASLAEHDLKCGWALQLTPAPSKPADNEHDIQLQFPLTKQTMDMACSKVLETLAISDEAAAELEKNTRLQSSSDQWHKCHAGRITASNFGRVCKCTWFKSRDLANIRNLLHDLTNPSTFRTNPPAPIKWGNDCEPVAVASYIEMKCRQRSNVRVSECGLFLHPVYKFLGATPDRLVNDPNSLPSEGLLEVKCPWKHCHCTVKDACMDPSFCCELQCGIPCLKSSHVYYYQIQGQLAITRQSWCDFVVYTTQDLHVERIFFNREFWSFVEGKLIEFYIACVLPQLVHSKGVTEIRSLLY